MKKKLFISTILLCLVCCFSFGKVKASDGENNYLCASSLLNENNEKSTNTYYTMFDYDDDTIGVVGSKKIRFINIYTGIIESEKIISDTAIQFGSSCEKRGNKLYLFKIASQDMYIYDFSTDTLTLKSSITTTSFEIKSIIKNENNIYITAFKYYSDGSSLKILKIDENENIISIFEKTSINKGGNIKEIYKKHFAAKPYIENNILYYYNYDSPYMSKKSFNVASFDLNSNELKISNYITINLEDLGIYIYSDFSFIKIGNKNVYVVQDQNSNTAFYLINGSSLEKLNNFYLSKNISIKDISFFNKNNLTFILKDDLIFKLTLNDILINGNEVIKTDTSNILTTEDIINTFTYTNQNNVELTKKVIFTNYYDTPKKEGEYTALIEVSDGFVKKTKEVTIKVSKGDDIEENKTEGIALPNTLFGASINTITSTIIIIGIMYIGFKLVKKLFK